MISALVPIRDATGERLRLWSLVRQMLEHEAPQIEIVEATDDGVDPFNKCMAINDAARRAAGDVLYVLDSDTYVPASRVLEAAALLADAGWTRPWSRKVKLTQKQTAKILACEGWDGTYDNSLRPEGITSYWSAPPLLLRRETFWDVGGMDERFRGWGGEDNAFGRALQRCGYGLVKRVYGDALHLWHPRLGKVGADMWAGQPEMWINRFLDAEYNQAGTEQKMRELIARRQEVAP